MLNEKLYKKIEQLKFMLECDELYISNYFSDLRTQIDLAFFNKELKIVNDCESLIEMRKNWHEMIYKINSLEEKCLLRRSINRYASNNSIFKYIESKLDEATTLSKTGQDDLSHVILELDDLVYNELSKLERVIFLNKTIIFLDRSKHSKDTKYISNYSNIFTKLNQVTTVGKLVITDEYFGERGINLIKNNDISYHLSNETIKCSNLVFDLINNPNANQIDERKMNLNSLNELVLYENHLSLFYNFLHTIDLNEKSIKIKQDLFCGLKKLKNLSIYKLKMKTIEDELFTELEDLNKLHIYENQLSSLDSPSIFRSLYNLKEILLFNNRITYVHPKIFNGLVNLVKIDLSRNQLKSLNEKLFFGLTNLKVINLSRNKLDTVEDNLFNGLICLTNIYLNDNQLKQINYRCFEGLVNLQEINLNNNPFLCESKDTIKFKSSAKFLSSC